MKAKIYQPTKNAMQSGMAKSDQWLLEFLPEKARPIDPLTGWNTVRETPRTLLSRFVGMLTDSRSFLSFPRHEYFRRVLCNMIGRDVVNGEIPDDWDLVSGLVRDVCYQNARQFFGFFPETA